MTGHILVGQALFALQAEMRAFAATKLGKLFLNYENLMQRAYQLDGSENASDRTLRESHEKADLARTALMEVFRPLAYREDNRA